GGAGAAGTGLWLILADIFRLPSARTSASIKRDIKRALASEKSGRIDLIAVRVTRFVAKGVKLNAGRRERLESELKAAAAGLTPEEFVAECLVRAAIPLAAAVPAAVFAPIFLPVVFAVIPGIFMDALSRPRRLIRARREAIEYELPMLAARIGTSLRGTRDVLTILNSYRKNAGPELKAELDVTVADMQSGSAHEALSRLETRVGSQSLSEVVRGLSAVLDGNDPAGYWTALEARLSDARRQALLRFAKRTPGKIAALSFSLLVCVFLIYTVVLGGEVMRSIGVIFG
ncbi:MAG: hypothetical protein ILO42_05270, partial [Clostridia bacterium]|nr:hypothetical protein [Clostridia bacterium]